MDGIFWKAELIFRYEISDLPILQLVINKRNDTK